MIYWDLDGVLRNLAQEIWGKEPEIWDEKIPEWNESNSEYYKKHPEIFLNASAYPYIEVPIF